MKKVLTLGFIIVLLFEVAGLSQIYVYEVRVKGSKSWGYADLDGEVIIEPAFKLAFEFSENGRALVFPKKGFELIDIQGKVMDVEVEKLKVITDPWSGIPCSSTKSPSGMRRVRRTRCCSCSGVC